VRYGISIAHRNRDGGEPGDDDRQGLGAEPLEPLSTLVDRAKSRRQSYRRAGRLRRPRGQRTNHRTGGTKQAAALAGTKRRSEADRLVESVVDRFGFKSLTLD
jgi:hypothetical protein